MTKIKQSWWELFQDPVNEEPITQTESGALSADKKTVYPFTGYGQLDFRITVPKEIINNRKIGQTSISENVDVFQILRLNPHPELDMSMVTIPKRLNKEIVSYFPKAHSADELALDVGCGDNKHQDICEQAGFEYIGVDYRTESAQVLADAHALPFKDARFSFVLAISMIQYLRYPDLGVNEMSRVLKPGGTLIGTVPSIEPFNDYNRYSFTHVGIYHILEEAGLEVSFISPIKEWNALKSLAHMSLFPKAPHWLKNIFVFPAYALHRLWWFFGSLISGGRKAQEKDRLFWNSAALVFIARKKQG